MTADTRLDVPSPIDLRSAGDARRWAETAMSRRPWREEIFARISAELTALGADRPSVLDLGSGPGFLAERILRDHPAVDYVALDFSGAMHDLARVRLGESADRVRFVVADFKEPDWTANLPLFDAVLTVQAVHEVRHKRHVPALYQQVRTRLSPDGIFLVCDHAAGEGGMSNTELYMTVEEHLEALAQGGFADTALLLQKSGLVLFRSTAGGA